MRKEQEKREKLNISVKIDDKEVYRAIKEGIKSKDIEIKGADNEI